jgi:hypothetical protein
MDERFKEIIAQCSNGWTKGEVLREDFNAKLKSYCEVLHDLGISDIPPDQICERLIHFCEKVVNNEPTLIGICNNVAVLVYRSTENHGNISVNTRKFVDFEIVACKYLSAL